MYSVLEIKSSEIKGCYEKNKKEGYGKLTIRQLRSLSRIIFGLEKELLESDFSKMVITFMDTDFIEDEEEFIKFLKELNKVFINLSENYGWNIIVLISKDSKIHKYWKYFVS